jgi:hypothetical protein
MMRQITCAVAALLLCAAFFPAGQSGGQELAAAPSLYHSPRGKPRVFITDSNSWSISGGFGGSGSGFGGGVRGGARPQTAEIIKTFGDKCPNVTVTMNQHAADFVVLLDHEGGKGLARKDNKIAVFNRAGDAIFSTSTRTLGSAVKDACKALRKAPIVAAPPQPARQDTPVAARSHAAPPSSAAPAAQSAAPTNPPSITQALAAADASEPCTVFVKSTPLGADISVDGNFVGNTPSTLKLKAGTHKVSVKMEGFGLWERTVKMSAGGNITLNAVLDKGQ